jgi:hypothetical protein
MGNIKHMKCDYLNCKKEPIRFVIVHLFTRLNDKTMISLCKYHENKYFIAATTEEITEEEAKTWEILEK